MNDTNPIIKHIESQIDDIAQDRAIASGLLGAKEQDALDNYVQIKKDNKINTGVRCIALDVIAQKYQLYHSPAERQKITDIIGQSLTNSSPHQIFDDTQLLKSNYAQIYQADRNAFDRVEKLLRNKLGLPPMTDISQHKFKEEDDVKEGKPSNPPSSPQNNNSKEGKPSNPPSSPQNNNSMVGTVIMMIGAILVAAWAFSMGQKSGPNSNQIDPIFKGKNSSTDLDNSSNISREAAINTVKNWIEYKRILLAPPYNKQPGADILVGKAYRNNVDKSSEPCNAKDPDDCLSSVDWLKKYNAQYSFGVQRIDSVDKFEASGNNGTILVTITEYRTLHKTGGRTVSSGGTKQARYDLQLDNGKVKINDYQVMN
jgi:hypothetical protein